MENAARNVIVAVQNSLLGALALQLAGSIFPVLILGTNLDWGESPNPLVWMTGFGFIITVIALVFAMWVIGHVANRRARVHASDTAMAWPRNGFEAWGDLPDGGLKPPLLMRRLVMALSAGGRPLDGVLLFLIFATSAFAVISIFRPEWLQIWRPGLTTNELRKIAYVAWLTAAVPISIRRWAFDSVKRMSPTAA